MEEEKKDIRVIIGLGNPGPQYRNHRHNIGFEVVNAFAAKYGGQWTTKGVTMSCDVHVGSKPIRLIKPKTFMNSSGQVITELTRKGIKPEQIVVVHDELEKKFGSLAVRLGGSHRGHNGLRSIIAHCGKEFWRLRFGIDRPQNKEDVPNYVLSNFQEDHQEISRLTEEAIGLLEEMID